MYENLKKRQRFANCSADADFEKVIDELEVKAEKAETLESENATLKNENDAFKQKEADAHKQEIETILQNARKEERFGENEVESYRTFLNKDFEAGKAAIEKRAPKKRVAQNILTDEHEPKESAWDARMSEIKQNLKK